MKNMYTDEIKIKYKKTNLICGIIFIISAVISLVVFFCNYSKYVTGIIELVCFIIVCILFSGLLFFGTGIFLIRKYNINNRKFKNMLNAYGEANIVEEIKHRTIAVFQSNQTNPKVYFTDRFIVEPSYAVIKYDEVNRIHVEMGRRLSLIFCLSDGIEYNLCYNIKPEEVNDIVQICLNHNRNIIFDGLYSDDT